MVTRAANNLSLQHSLENFWYERLRLHFVLHVHMVPEGRLDQILQKDQQEFLSVGLLPDVESI